MLHYKIEGVYAPSTYFKKGDVMTRGEYFSKKKNIDVYGNSIIAESSIDGSKRSKIAVFKDVIFHDKKNLVLSGCEDVDERDRNGDK